MKTAFTFSPASIDRKPDPKQYYGVTFHGYHEEASENSPPTRAFIASWSGYPSPLSFITICASNMTAGNTWDKIKEKNDKHESMGLEDYIIYLCQTGWKVYEFDTARELFMWLAECEDKKPRDKRW